MTLSASPFACVSQKSLTRWSSPGLHASSSSRGAEAEDLVIGGGFVDKLALAVKEALGVFPTVLVAPDAVLPAVDWDLQHVAEALSLVPERLHG